MKALLFDLDGTLLGMDGRVFLEQYLQTLSDWFVDFMDAKVFLPRLLKSTQAMIDNQDPSKTNKEIFIDSFFEELELTPEEVMPHFARFYRNEFPKLARYTERLPEAREVVVTALESGLEVVLATNPVFPREAIVERMRWAGIADLPFKLITSYEFMHYCKPHQGYYQEILKILALSPDDCLMVGNDVEEDLPAGLLGMRTFLVDGYVISRGQFNFSPSWRGSLLDLKKWIVEMAAIQ